MKEQDKIPGKKKNKQTPKQKGDKQSTRGRVQNVG